MTRTSIYPMLALGASLRQPLTVLTSALIACMFASATRAQVFVTDSAAISSSEEGFKSQLVQTVEQYTKQGMQYTKQLQEYETQLKQYQQLAMKAQGLGTDVSIAPTNLQQISEPAALISQNCPGPSSGLVAASMVSSIASSFSLGDPITKSQQQICANIVLLQVDKYNKTVIVLNDLNKYGGTLQTLNDLANEITNVGNASNATTQAETVSVTMARSMHDWKTSVAADQTLIDSLEDQQKILAKVAMKGSQLGNVVQAAAFATAFSND